MIFLAIFYIIIHTYIPHTLFVTDGVAVVVADADAVSPILPCSWQYRYRQEQSDPILLCSAQYRFLIWEHSYPILPDSQQYRSLIRELVNSHPMLHGSLQCGPKREQSIKRFRDTEITDTCYSISMSTSPSEFVLAMCLKTFFASNFCTLRTSAGLKSFLISNYLWM